CLTTCNAHAAEFDSWVRPAVVRGCIAGCLISTFVYGYCLVLILLVTRPPPRAAPSSSSSSSSSSLNLPLHIIPTGCAACEAFRQVYLATQFPRSRQQAIQSFQFRKQITTSFWLSQLSML